MQYVIRTRSSCVFCTDNHPVFCVFLFYSNHHLVCILSIPASSQTISRDSSTIKWRVIRKLCLGSAISIETRRDIMQINKSTDLKPFSSAVASSLVCLSFVWLDCYSPQGTIQSSISSSPSPRRDRPICRHIHVFMAFHGQISML